jgi:hypothetical protein
LPAKDRHHDILAHALVKAGWTIDEEQVTLQTLERTLWIDFQISKRAADIVLLVELKELEAVASPIESLAGALGKYLLYRLILARTGKTTPLFLAVTNAAYAGVLSEEVGRWMLDEYKIPLIVFDAQREEIIQWVI